MRRITSAQWSALRWQASPSSSRGKDRQPAVVVLAADEYERLCLLDKAHAPSLGRLFLQILQDDGEFERLSISASGILESHR